MRKSPRAVTAPKNHPTDLLALGWIRHSQVAVGLGQTAARFANRFLGNVHEWPDRSGFITIMNIRVSTFHAASG